MEIKLFSSVDTPSDYTASKNRKIEYIVLHYTAGVTCSGTSALSVCKWWNKDPNKASADFVVDDENIWQYNPDIRNNYCWHGGGKKYNYKGGARLYGVCKNSNSISIELCSYRDDKNAKATAEEDGWRINDAVMNNGVKLVQQLRAEYNIPAENVITHFDITGKLCPRPFLVKNGDTWKIIDSVLSKFKEEPKQEDAIANTLKIFETKHKGNVFLLQRNMIDIAVTTSIESILKYDTWKCAYESDDGYVTLISERNTLYIVKLSTIKII